MSHGDPLPKLYVASGSVPPEFSYKLSCSLPAGYVAGCIVEGWIYDPYTGCSFDYCYDEPCINGDCFSDTDNFLCSCYLGWTGENCDANIDDCIGDPCVHGTCLDDVNSYVCICNVGWTGGDCDVNRDDCIFNPCAHGYCLDGEDSYTCTCDQGYTGQNCNEIEDIDDCINVECGSHRYCLDKVASYECVCSPGYAGPDCVEIDECEQNPCAHGDCTDKVNSYECSCEPGYGGLICDEPESETFDCADKNPCAPENTILNGYYYANSDPTKYVQCNEFGSCNLMNCASTLIWYDDHKSCGPL